MGTSIRGWIEIGDPEEQKYWDGIVKIGGFLDRNYKNFAYLFGERNNFDFKPVAAMRGLPENISPEAKRDHQENPGHSESWIGWWELEAMQWTHDANGSWIAPNEQVVLTDDWKLAFDFMKMLADYYGKNYVRWVVWFD